jgi:hypothetical protein
MGRRRRNPWFWFCVGAGTIVLAGTLGAAAVHDPVHRPWDSLVALAPGISKPPVLVFLVGSEQRVALVRTAVADHRLVDESPSAFLRREARLVAATRADAASLLSQDGWRDRDLEIFEFGRPETRGETSRGSSELSQRDDANTARLAELMNRPTLTWVEARAVLSQWK